MDGEASEVTFHSEKTSSTPHRARKQSKFLSTHSTGGGPGRSERSAHGLSSRAGDASTSPRLQQSLSLQMAALSANHDHASDTLVSTATTYARQSPRAKFLAGCIAKGIAPLSSIMLRPAQSRVLDLEHEGMGDELAVLLAGGLNAMPSIQIINIADNNLTDRSLKPLLDAIVSNPNIIELDLSENKLDAEASEALGAYLEMPGCSLKCLRLKHADVDDSECHAMLQKLFNNRILEVWHSDKNL